MTVKSRYLPVIVSFSLACIAAPASAQIYVSKLPNGTEKYSSEPPRDKTASYRVLGTAYQATRAADARYVRSYDQIIQKHATHYDVSPQLVRAVIQVESGFNPRAVSSKGAMGLMQLMPGTAIEMGVRNPFDPEENIRGGVAYLRGLLNRYGGDRRLALAAYNAGPETVARYRSVPPFAETRKYIAKVGNVAGGGAPVIPSVAQTKATAPAVSAPAARARMYKWTETTPDGRVITKYGDTKPAKGPYEIVR